MLKAGAQRGSIQLEAKERWHALQCHKMTLSSNLDQLENGLKPGEQLLAMVATT